MTDVAVTAPAEAASEPVVAPPNPISTDNTNPEAKSQKPEPAKVEAEPKKAEEPAPRKSTRDALKEASRKVEASEKAKGQDRHETGQFKGTEVKTEGKTDVPQVAKPGDQPQADKAQNTEAQKPADPAKPKFEAPSRWDDAAKRDWDTATESIKGAVTRTVRELETGIQEHQKRWEPIKEYDDLAKQHGTDLPSALKRYVAMDRLLSENLTAGLESIIRDKTGGQYGLREIVAHLTGQKPEQIQQQTDGQIHKLLIRIDQLEQQLGGVVKTTRVQTAQTIDQQVAAFAADKPDFEALSPKIAEHIGKGMDLEAAYNQAKTDAEALAATLGYVKPSQAPAQTRSEPDTAVPQTDKGQKSISGAPSAGTTPPKAKPGSTSIRDSLKRALAAAS